MGNTENGIHARDRRTGKGDRGKCTAFRALKIDLIAGFKRRQWQQVSGQRREF